MTVRCPQCRCLVDTPNDDEETSEFEIMDSATSVICPNCGVVPIPVNLAQTELFGSPTGSRQNTTIAHFVLTRLLGKGAFGEVWLAHDVDLGRSVALKLPRPERIDSSTLMFEAKTAASLRHPNIVAIFQVGSQDGQVFIASEFIDGLTLQDLMSAGRPSVSRTVELMTTIAKALHYAHQQGIVHRDIKPANILLNRDGQPFITDFGIAKHVDPAVTIQVEGQVIGTARYMSPEQASGMTRETDHRSDIYAAGVMLFEMLTGDAPFRGNMRAILHQKILEDSPSPRTLDAGIPRDLETICLKCLERVPEKRYSSALVLAEELERFAANEPILARPISRTERAWRWCRKRPAITGLAVGLVSSLTIGLLGVSYFWLEASRSAAAASHSAEVALRSLYRARMNLMAVHVESGNIAAATEMLDQVAADPALRAMRGFEGDYYRRLTEPMNAVANHGDSVTDVAVSHDGDLCASIGRSPEVRIWESRTGQLHRALTIEAERVDSIDFSPTSMLLATGSVDGFVRIWNVAEDGPQTFQASHGPQIKLVRFSPDGKLVLAAGKFGAVRVWDHTQSMLVAEIPTGRESEIREARFLADSQHVAIALRNGLVRVWKVDTPVSALAPGTRWEIADELEAFGVSDDGELFVSGDYHGALTIRSGSAGEGVQVETNWGRIDDIEFLKGTHLLAVVSNDGELHLFDADRRREFRTAHTHGLAAGSLARSANGAALVVGSGNGTITRIDLKTLTTPGILWHEAPVRRVEFLDGNTQVVAVDERGTLNLWNLETGQSEQLARGGEKAAAWTISAQESGTLVARGGSGPNVEIWDASDLTMIRELEVPPTGTSAVKFSPSGRQLAVAPRRAPIRIYRDNAWETPALELPATEANVVAMAYADDDRFLAIARDDKTVEIFEPFGEVLRHSSVVLQDAPSAVAFCRAGNQLAIGTANGEIQFWDLQGHRIRQVIRGHSGQINSLASFPESDTLASGGRDRTLKLWDVGSGELITPLVGHFRQVFAIAVAPDGRTIVSGGLEGDLRIWRGGATGGHSRSVSATESGP